MQQEEDQASQSEENSSQVNVLSVSVTFRQHTGEESDQAEQEGNEEATVEINKDDDNNNNDDDDDDFAALPSESHCSANPPATLDTNTEECHIGNENRTEKDGGLTETNEVLKGWKGYSNNIYIQPIIVHHAVTSSCPRASSESRRRRQLTSEDLRKQMRIRESSSWITKHNELTSSTGSLRVGESSGDACQGTKIQKPRIWKGFVCRRWASEFLPEDYVDIDDECTPFTVRRYVARSSNVSAAKTVSETEGALRTGWSLRRKSSAECRDGLGVNIGEGSGPEGRNIDHPETMPMAMNVVVNRPLEEQEREVESLSCTDSLFQQTSEKVEQKFSCSCKADICNAELFRERIAGCRGESRGGSTMTAITSSRRFKPLGIALPVKQFPPINPLREVKKRAPHKRERPCTVDAAFVTRGLVKTSGRGGELCTLEGRGVATRRAAPNVVIGQRMSSCPPLSREEHRHREKPSSIVRREIAGPLEMNDADEMLRLIGYDRWSGTNDSDISSEENVPRCNFKVSAGHRNPRQLKTPPRAVSRKDRLGSAQLGSVRLGSAVSNLSDTGLGSEFELSPDGFSRLDVFLKPSVESGYS